MHSPLIRRLINHLNVILTWKSASLMHSFRKCTTRVNIKSIIFWLKHSRLTSRIKCLVIEYSSFVSTLSKNIARNIFLKRSIDDFQFTIDQWWFKKLTRIFLVQRTLAPLKACCLLPPPERWWKMVTKSSSLLVIIFYIPQCTSGLL